METELHIDEFRNMQINIIGIYQTFVNACLLVGCMTRMITELFSIESFS